MYAVYKYVYKGEIIYVGQVTTDLHRRLTQHSSEGKFSVYKDVEIFYAELLNSVEAYVYEAVLINNYRPVLNKAMKCDESRLIKIDMSVLEWVKYELPINKNSIEIAIQKWNEKQVMSKDDYSKIEEERAYEMAIHKSEIKRINEKEHRKKNRKKGSGGYMQVNDRVYHRLRKTINGNVKSFYGKTEEESQKKYDEYMKSLTM